MTEEFLFIRVHWAEMEGKEGRREGGRDEGGEKEEREGRRRDGKGKEGVAKARDTGKHELWLWGT